MPVCLFADFMTENQQMKISAITIQRKAEATKYILKFEKSGLNDILANATNISPEKKVMNIFENKKLIINSPYSFNGSKK